MPVTGKNRKVPGRKRKEPSVEIPCDRYQYERQEIILCYHGPQLYKAKVLKRTVQGCNDREQVMYFVHYHGWNQQWDEWVTADRCLKHTEENLETMNSLKADLAQTKQKRSSKSKISLHKRKRQIGDSDESDSDTLIKSNRTSAESKEPEKLHFESMLKEQQTLKMQDLDDLELNSKIESHREKMRKHPLSSSTGPPDAKRHRSASTSFRDKLKTIIIPTALKDALVDQYNVIHYDEKVIKLPKARGLTINDILRDCLEEQRHKVATKREKNMVDLDDLKAAESITECLPFINNGLKGFFKNTLRLNLLYNFEKPQLEELLKSQGEDCDLCAIYGAEHLIRLFYILPNILVHTRGVHEDNFSPIKQCVSILIHFLTKHKQRYLGSLDVETVDEKYIAAQKKIAKQYHKKVNAQND